MLDEEGGDLRRMSSGSSIPTGPFGKGPFGV
jgi:hypothetical protein